MRPQLEWKEVTTKRIAYCFECYVPSGNTKYTLMLWLGCTKEHQHDYCILRRDPVPLGENPLVASAEFITGRGLDEMFLWAENLILTPLEKLAFVGKEKA